MIISGRQGATPNDGFRVTDASAPPLVDLDTAVTGRIDPAGQDNLYRIAGARGRRLKYDAEAVVSKTAQARKNA